MALQPIKLPATRGEFLKAAANMPEQSLTEPTEAQRRDARNWFNPIFREICIHCPGWKNAIPDDGGIETAARVWFETLTSKRQLLQPDVIKRGMRALQAKRLTWLPSPLDFVDMCLEDESLPSLKEAFSEVRSKAHSAKFRVKGDPEIEYSHPMVKYLAGKCGGLFLTGIGERQAREAFADEYRAATEKFRVGYFDESATPKLEAQPMDSNLAYYLGLKRDFPHVPNLADEYLQECKSRGIYLDVENMTVTKNASLIDNKKQVVK